MGAAFVYSRRSTTRAKYVNQSGLRYVTTGGIRGKPGIATWTFFAYAVVAAPNFAIEQNLSILDPTVFAVLYSLSIVALCTQFALLMQFAVLVPDDRPPPGWRTVAYRVAIGDGAARDCRRRRKAGFDGARRARPIRLGGLCHLLGRSEVVDLAQAGKPQVGRVVQPVRQIVVNKFKSFCKILRIERRENLLNALGLLLPP